MKQRPLVAFTILAQMAVGMAWTLGVVRVGVTSWADPPLAGRLMLLGWPAIALLMAGALLSSFSHLGVPQNAWRAARNWRSSRLSREILAALAFTGAAALFVAQQRMVSLAPAITEAIAWTVALLGAALIYAMADAYRLPTVPAWNTWLTPISFFVTTFLLGNAATAMIIAFSYEPGPLARLPLQGLALIMIGLSAVNLALTSVWVARLAGGSPVAARAAAAITQRHRLAFNLRAALAVLSMISTALILPALSGGVAIRATVALSFGSILVAEALGRSLFYAGQVRHDVYLYSG